MDNWNIQFNMLNEIAVVMQSMEEKSTFINSTHPIFRWSVVHASIYSNFISGSILFSELWSDSLCPSEKTSKKWRFLKRLILLKNNVHHEITLRLGYWVNMNNIGEEISTTEVLPQFSISEHTLEFLFFFTPPIYIGKLNIYEPNTPFLDGMWFRPLYILKFHVLINIIFRVVKWF